MSEAGFLADEFDDSNGLSRNAIELCCAIVEDAEGARQFEYPRRGAVHLLATGLPGNFYVPRECAPLVSELTSLIA